MMSSLSSSVPPIHRLNDDIFLYILDLNTNIFAEDGALVTSRATSQVCHSWRELMLALPLLWAKLLDFDVIGQHQVEALWVDELLRRSGGESVLRIKANRVLGILDPPRPTLQELFLNVLSENWNRIQVLVVNLRWSNFDLRRTFCNTISLPAPALVSFDFTAGVSTEDIPYQAIPGKFDHPLFANQAPCLRAFKTTLHNFDLRAPWVQNLSDMYIGHAFPLSGVLDVLSTTNNLKYLEIGEVALNPDEVKHLRHINLPRLHRLKLSVDANTCLAILDHLKMPHACSFLYNAPNKLSAADMAEGVFTPLVRKLAKLAKRYFKGHPPIHLALHRKPGILCFSDMRPAIAFGFLALLQCSDGSDFSTDAINTFFTQFSTLRFPKATHLWLELSADTPSQLWRPFLERFPTVQTMLISIRDIGLFEIFTQLLVQTRVLPSLQIIKLRPGEQFHPIHLKRNEMEVIAVFKVLRMMTGRPLQIAHLSE